jgi:hypothetical protein
MLREKQPADIAVLVGHNSSMLPIGILLDARTDGRGLHTSTTPSALAHTAPMNAAAL